MNKWFIIYCLWILFKLVRGIVGYTKTDTDTSGTLLAIIFMVFASLEIGIIYLAVREGF